MRLKLISLAIILLSITGAAFAGVRNVWAEEQVPCSLSSSPASPTIGQTVTFTATSCGTPPLQFGWSFGDGTTGAGNPVTHIFQAAGSYIVTLSVTEAQGSTAVVTQLVNVEPEFELRVSLLSQKVPLSGVGAFNIKIVPHNNFATSVTLNVSFSGSLYQIQQECSRINDFDNCGLQCGFDVATPFGIDCGQKTVSAGQTTTLMISPLPPLQSNTVYSFTLHATPCPTNPPCSQDSSTQSKDISFSVAALTGV